jgi:uncharacterized protein
LNFLDANVWLALIWGRHAHSGRARAWVEGAEDGSFYFCRFTQLTVLRLLTTQAVMGRDVQTTSRAWALWDRLAADERTAFLAEPESIEAAFRYRSSLRRASPKVWADAYLLAFAAMTGLQLVTFDRALRLHSNVLVLS